MLECFINIQNEFKSTFFSSPAQKEEEIESNLHFTQDREIIKEKNSHFYDITVRSISFPGSI